MINPGENAQEELQEALILMSEGDTLLIKSGYYLFEDGLSLDVDNVTIIGEGLDKTILTVSYTHLTLPTKRIV